jgi:hypothetical protein
MPTMPTSKPKSSGNYYDHHRGAWRPRDPHGYGGYGNDAAHEKALASGNHAAALAITLKHMRQLKQAGHITQHEIDLLYG